MQTTALIEGSTPVRVVSTEKTFTHVNSGRTRSGTFWIEFILRYIVTFVLIASDKISHSDFSTKLDSVARSPAIRVNVFVISLKSHTEYASKNV
jgi:hypothetical protein